MSPNERLDLDDGPKIPWRSNAEGGPRRSTVGGDVSGRYALVALAACCAGPLVVVAVTSGVAGGLAGLLSGLGLLALLLAIVGGYAGWRVARTWRRTARGTRRPPRRD